MPVSLCPSSTVFWNTIGFGGSQGIPEIGLRKDLSPPAILFGVAIVVIFNQRSSLIIVVSILTLGIYPALPIAAEWLAAPWRGA
jgi:hypothetical protein